MTDVKNDNRFTYVDPSQVTGIQTMTFRRHIQGRSRALARGLLGAILAERRNFGKRRKAKFRENAENVLGIKTTGVSKTV